MSLGERIAVLLGPRSLRYLVGAGLCALVSNAVLIAMDLLDCPLLANVLLSWFAGGLIGYVWHSQVTYGEPARLSALARFMGGALLGVPLAWAALYLFHDLAGWPMWLAAPATTVVLFCYHWCNAWLAIRWTPARRALSGWLGRA